MKDPRHWVSTLKYIKEYCSRLEVRYTVISAEQEIEFVRRALEDDADSTGVSCMYVRTGMYYIILRMYCSVFVYPSTYMWRRTVSIITEQPLGYRPAGGGFRS